MKIDVEHEIRVESYYIESKFSLSFYSSYKLTTIIHNKKNEKKTQKHFKWTLMKSTLCALDFHSECSSPNLFFIFKIAFRLSLSFYIVFFLTSRFFFVVLCFPCSYSHRRWGSISLPVSPVNQKKMWKEAALENNDFILNLHTLTKYKKPIYLFTNDTRVREEKGKKEKLSLLWSNLYE
jgi:hypothetical protein